MTGLIRFRWIAIVFMMLGVFPLWRWGYLQKGNLPYFMGVLALLAVFNALTQGIFSADKEESSSKILVHLLVDLLAATGLLFVSGSANNPFISILCVNAFLGGMLLRGLPSWLFMGVVLFLLSLLQLETFWDEKVTVGGASAQIFLNFLSQWVLMIASWLVSHYFSKILHENESRIRFLQTRQHRADRLKALGALTAGFSHELATPMNSLKLRMERGFRKFDSEGPLAARTEFEKAQASLKDCVEVFQNMASVFSRSAQTELSLVNVHKILSEVLQAWKKDNPQVEVEQHFVSEPLPCRIQLLAFSQALFDLMDNAMEASLNKMPITVRLYSRDKWIFIEIIDQGSGLSSEVLSRLGEPFVTSKLQGNGLGVYSAMMMAQAVGGEFKIANNSSGRGVTVQMCLPLENA